MVFCFLFLWSSVFSLFLAFPFSLSGHLFSQSKAICFLSLMSTICFHSSSPLLSLSLVCFFFFFVLLFSLVLALCFPFFRYSVFFLESLYFYYLGYMFSLSSVFCFLSCVFCFLFHWSYAFSFSGLLLSFSLAFSFSGILFSFSPAFCFPFLTPSANFLLGLLFSFLRFP